MGQELSVNELQRDNVQHTPSNMSSNTSNISLNTSSNVSLNMSSNTSQDDFKKCFIYVLRLVEGKYYVGKTRNLMRRFSDHQNGVGSQWTIKYKTIFIEDVFESTGQFDEDNCTKKLMMKHGIDNVRGGTYSNIVLDDDQIRFLEKEFHSANNACFRCGSIDHFNRNCPNVSAQTSSEKIIVKDTDHEFLNTVAIPKYSQQSAQTHVKNTVTIPKYSEQSTQIHVKSIVTIPKCSQKNPQVHSTKVTIPKCSQKNDQTHSISAPKDIVSNHGCKWTEAASRALIWDYRKGLSIKELAIKYGRTEGAISSRLDKLELSDSSD
jgi:hypothetical protein